MWTQKRFQLPAQKRGFHLVTKEIENELPQIQSISKGLLHLFIQHTSASLSINENADPSVRRDMEAYFTRNVKENEPYYEHTLEGPDDMPAHIKSVILGCELTLPIRNGALALGTWQGIYLGEHRNYGGPRTIIATIQGE